DASASPHLGDVGQIEVVLIVLGIAQWRRLGVNDVATLADIGGAQDTQPLGVGGHDPVLDAVVDHLHEVSGAVRAAVEISPLGGPGGVAAAGTQRRENGTQFLPHGRLAADHQAVAALSSPDAAAGPDVHVVNALGGELPRAPDVVDVVGITAVDDDVP